MTFLNLHPHSISLNSPYCGCNANRVIMLQAYFNFQGWGIG
jgi:hypothetical protein